MLFDETKMLSEKNAENKIYKLVEGTLTLDLLCCRVRVPCNNSFESHNSLWILSQTPGRARMGVSIIHKGCSSSRRRAGDDNPPRRASGRSRLGASARRIHMDNPQRAGLSLVVDWGIKLKFGWKAVENKYGITPN